MSFVLIVCVSAFILQSINSQCLPSLNVGNTNGGLYNIAPAYGNSINVANNGLGCTSNNIGFSSNIGYASNNFGYSPNNVGLAALSLENAIPYESTLTILSGSPAFDIPTGITIVADNLEIGGSVTVSGSLPFLGAVNVNGNVPAGGQAALSYSAGPGVSLTSAGCGAGLTNAGVVKAGANNINGLGGGVLSPGQSVLLGNNYGGIGSGLGVSSCNVY